MDKFNSSNMKINILSKEIASRNVRRMMEIEKDYPEPWTEENFLFELLEKWELSRYADLDKNIAGFIIASHKHDSFYIHRFMVDSNQRGKGIGKILYSNFENSCVQRGDEDNISLRVLINNLPTVKLYHTLGFEIVSEEEGVRYLMKKRIK